MYRHCHEGVLHWITALNTGYTLFLVLQYTSEATVVPVPEN